MQCWTGRLLAFFFFQSQDLAACLWNDNRLSTNPLCFKRLKIVQNLLFWRTREIFGHIRIYVSKFWMLSGTSIEIANSTQYICLWTFLFFWLILYPPLLLLARFGRSKGRQEGKSKFWTYQKKAFGRWSQDLQCYFSQRVRKIDLVKKIVTAV